MQVFLNMQHACLLNHVEEQHHCPSSSVLLILLLLKPATTIAAGEKARPMYHVASAPSMSVSRIKYSYTQHTGFIVFVFVTWVCNQQTNLYTAGMSFNGIHI